MYKGEKTAIVPSAELDSRLNLISGDDIKGTRYKNYLTSDDGATRTYPILNASKAINNMVQDKLVKPMYGWIKLDGKWYYYLNGVKQTGWKQVDSKWYYMDSNGVMQTGWQTIDGKSYYFDSDGVWVK